MRHYNFNSVDLFPLGRLTIFDIFVGLRKNFLIIKLVVPEWYLWGRLTYRGDPEDLTKVQKFTYVIGQNFF